MSEIYEILNGIVTNPLVYIPAIIAGAVLVTKASDRMNDESAELYIASLKTPDTPNLKLIPEGKSITLDAVVNE